MRLGPLEILIVAYLALLIFIGVLIFRDAKKKALPHTAALTWAIASVIAFPIGTLAYFMLVKPSIKHEFQPQVSGEASTKSGGSTTRSFARRHGGLIAIVVYLLFMAGTDLLARLKQLTFFGSNKLRIS